jgi:hypothetical protein
VSSAWLVPCHVSISILATVLVRVASFKPSQSVGLHFLLVWRICCLAGAQ